MLVNNSLLSPLSPPADPRCPFAWRCAQLQVIRPNFSPSTPPSTCDFPNHPLSSLLPSPSPSSPAPPNPHNKNSSARHVMRYQSQKNPLSLVRFPAPSTRALISNGIRCLILISSATSHDGVWRMRAGHKRSEIFCLHRRAPCMVNDGRLVALCVHEVAVPLCLLPRVKWKCEQKGISCLGHNPAWSITSCSSQSQRQSYITVP